MYASERPVRQPHHDRADDARPDHTTCPVLICLLGPFRVLQAGQPVPMRGGKMEALLCHLALRYASGSPRAVLLETLWPDGAAPVLQVDGGLRLNAAAGVSVDVANFDALAATGDQQARTGDMVAAAAAYQHALQLYRGDLCVAPDLHAAVERERLRARYLSLLASLATYAYAARDHAACLAYAHRLVMRCHVRRGERAQALPSSCPWSWMRRDGCSTGRRWIRKPAPRGGLWAGAA